MKAIHIRDIDEKTLNDLKRLARNHHRSLQGELHAILERAAHMAPPEGQAEDFSLTTVRTDNESTWNREDIYGNQGR